MKQKLILPQRVIEILNFKKLGFLCVLSVLRGEKMMKGK